MFGKKKQPDIPTDVEEYEEIEKPASPRKPAPSFEDILKELTGEADLPPFSEKEKSKPLEHVAPERQSYEPVLATELIDYQNKNIEALGEDDLIDIVPHKPEPRKKPEYKRDARFAIEEGENEIADDLKEMLSDYDGARKAIVLKEIFDRKY